MKDWPPLLAWPLRIALVLLATAIHVAVFSGWRSVRGWEEMALWSVGSFLALVGGYVVFKLYERIPVRRTT